jgi:hypothetical protein
MHHGGRILSGPGKEIWTPSNELAQSRHRESSAPQVPGYQWDALKAWRCGCQLAIIRPPAIRSLTAPGARAGLAGDSPETRRCPSDPRSEGQRRVSGEATAGLPPCQREWAGRVAVSEGPEAGLLGSVGVEHPTSNIQHRTGRIGGHGTLNGEAIQSHINATSKPPQSVLIAKGLGPQSHPKATPMRPQSHPNATLEPPESHAAGKEE